MTDIEWVPTEYRHNRSGEQNHLYEVDPTILHLTLVEMRRNNSSDLFGFHEIWDPDMWSFQETSGLHPVFLLRSTTGLQHLQKATLGKALHHFNCTALKII